MNLSERIARQRVRTQKKKSYINWTYDWTLNNGTQYTTNTVRQQKNKHIYIYKTVYTHTESILIAKRKAKRAFLCVGKAESEQSENEIKWGANEAAHNSCDGHFRCVFILFTSAFSGSVLQFVCIWCIMRDGDRQNFNSNTHSLALSSWSLACYRKYTYRTNHTVAICRLPPLQSLLNSSQCKWIKEIYFHICVCDEHDICEEQQQSSHQAKNLYSLSRCVSRSTHTHMQTLTKTGNHNNKATVCHADAITKVFTAICFVCQRVLGCQSVSHRTERKRKFAIFRKNLNFTLFLHRISLSFFLPFSLFHFFSLTAMLTTVPWLRSCGQKGRQH